MPFVLSPMIKFKATYANGCPLVGGKVYTYLAGTTTPVASYVSEDGAANTNPVILNAKGEADVWLDPTIAYKIEVQDSEGNVITPPVDNIKVGPTGLNIAILDTIGDLRNYTGTATLIYVRGYNEADDECGGWVYWNSEINIADDGVIFFQQNSAPMVGRFVRVYDGGPISIRYAGDPGNLDSSDTTTQLCLAHIAEHGGSLYYPPGLYVFDDSSTFPNILVQRDRDAIFQIKTGEVLTFQGKIMSPATLWQQFGSGYAGTMNLAATNDTTAYPEWYGAVGDGEGDDQTAITRLWATNCPLYNFPSPLGYLVGSDPGLPTATNYSVYCVLGIFTSGPTFVMFAGTTTSGNLFSTGTVSGAEIAGNTANIVGNINSTSGNITVAAGNISSTLGQVTAGTLIKAQTLIGSGLMVGGQFAQGTGGANSGTGETTLATISVPAFLSAENDSMVVEGYLLVGAESVLRLKFGGTTFGEVTIPVSSGNCWFKARLRRRNTNASAVAFTSVVTNADSTRVDEFNTVGLPSMDSTQTMLITGQSAGGGGNITLFEYFCEIKKASV